MQISKSLLVLSAVLLGILPQSIRAADTEAQIKAREALRQKLNELQPQSGNEITPAAPAPAPTAPPAVRRTPPQATRPVPPIAAPAPTQADSDAVARSRDALRKKMQELEGQPVPEKAPPISTPPVAPAPRPVTRATPSPRPVPPAAPTVVPATPSAEPPVVVKPRRPARPTPTPAPAVAQETQKPARASSGPTYTDLSSPGTPAPVAPKATVTTPAAPSSPTVATTSPSQERWEAEKAAQNQTLKPKAESKSRKTVKPSDTYKPIEGPPLGISSDKEQRLHELLRRYQADEVTPAQYHEERAKILAAP